MTQPSRFTPYQRRLFIFLSVATFFEGYDFMAVTQILPNLREDMGLPLEASAYVITVVNVGSVLAFLIVRKADVWGRRRVLTVTIAGYTLFTLFTALSPNVWWFAIFQMIARIFLIGEWAISMVIAAEEFPAERRGMVIGVIQACASLGSVMCAGVVPLLLQTPFGWRSVYLVGVVPLLLLAYARRGLRETTRFAERGESKDGGSLFDLWRSPYRNRMLMVASIWFVSYIAAQNGVSFWKEFAVGERAMTDGQVGAALAIASLVAMPFVFASGKFLDMVGRRFGALVIFMLMSVGTFGAYTLHGFWPLTAALVLGIMSASAFLPVMNAYTTELFPTEYRGAAFAWANNILGRIAYVVSPLVIGFFVADIGGYGPVVAATAVFPILSIILIYAMLPETKARELEDTARLGDH